MNVKAIKPIIFIIMLAAFVNLPVSSVNAEENKTGGGYAASRQIEGVGYTSEIYDATNGLPTSDANFILGASNGYVWIGGYSGIIRYDGSVFERLDTADGLTSGRGFMEDSYGRIWVATNDNGVVVIDNDNTVHITYKDGLTSSSIRAFAEDKEGNVYVGSTAGVCYVDADMKVHQVDDERINNEGILKLDADISKTKSHIVSFINPGPYKTFSLLPNITFVCLELTFSTIVVISGCFLIKALMKFL